MPVETFNTYDTRDDLAAALSDQIADRLTLDNASGDFASVALSGGSTPKLMFDQLQSKLGATREMIYFALVDERYVAASDPRSNEHMIRTHLGLLEHPATEFLSLYHDGLQVQDAAVKCQEKLLEDEELPFDVMTLGMGTDGHTASFFPGGDNLDAATDPATDVLFMPMTAPGAQETRITMTLPAIVSAKYLVLHIEGEEKRRVYEEALKDGPANDMPIRHVLRHPDAKLHVYWAP